MDSGPEAGATALSIKKYLFLAAATLVVAASPSDSTAKDFNDYILKSVELLATTRAGGGYDIKKAFSRNLSYGTSTIRASQPPLTMCVAAVQEVIVEAINLYARDKGNEVYSLIPVESWSKGNITSLRANIFMYAGTGSRGTGYSLERFGIGDELKFSELKPGDFLNFNRTSGNGHAVVFLGYLDKNSQPQQSYSSAVVGFKYFSAQGKEKPDAGFGYRNAYFDGHCPNVAVGAPRDCDIIFSNNLKLLDGGRMFHPTQWRYAEAVSQIKEGIRSTFETDFPDATRAFVDDLVQSATEIEMSSETEIPDFFNGVTTD